MSRLSTRPSVCNPASLLFALTIFGSLGPRVVAQSPTITEFAARNATGHAHPTTGRRHDWIEVHNPSAVPIQLRDFGLTDDRDQPNKWRFGARMLAPGGYEIIYASGQGWALGGQPFHTNFELDGDGEYLALTAADGSVVIEYDKRRQVRDQSFGFDTQGTRGYFETPTPGAPNIGAALAYVAKKANADQPRGRHDAAFTVTLASPSQRKHAAISIRYTLDGSAPTRTHGQLYSGPFRVDRSTILRTVAFGPQHAASKVETYSYLFFDDVATQSAQQPQLPSNWGVHQNQNGPFTRRADYGVDPAIAQPASAVREALESLPVLSIAIDADDMFDAQRGIYANPQERGQAWERPASIEILYPNMGRRQQLDVGVRISGRASRRPDSNPKHSMRLIARDAYGPAVFDARLFGLGGARKHNAIVLRSMFNDSFVPNPDAIYVRDMFARDTHAEVGGDRARGIFCHLFVNGLYWGVYNPTERPDAAFQAEYHEGETADYDVLRHHGNVVDGDRNAHNAARAIVQGGAQTSAEWQALQEYIDLSHLADYLLVQFYSGTNDWPGNNWYMARKRAPGETFRFYIWDAEFALERPLADLMGVFWHEGPGLFYDQLRNHPEFQMLMADRVRALMLDDGPLTTERSLARFERRVEQLRSAILVESARWGDALRLGTRTPADWERNLDRVRRDFFPLRNERVLAQLRRVGFWPSVSPPSFNRAAGVVRSGERLTMHRPPLSTQIWFTTDGSDPRAFGGGVAANAQVYAGPIAIRHGMRVRARALQGSTWSAETAASFRSPSLVINEVLASNKTTLRDRTGKSRDWIELFNPTSNPIDAGGMFLTDDRRRPSAWEFPAGTIIAPSATLLVWAGGASSADTGELHANFKLDRSGDEAFLFDRDGATLLSGFRFGPQQRDVSIGRLVDGDERSPLVTYPRPTPAADNAPGTGARLFSGHAPDLHTLSLEVQGSGQIGSIYSFRIDQGPVSDAVLLFIASDAAYSEPVAASALAVLLGPSIVGSLVLPTDGSGSTQTIPVPLPVMPQLLGLRLYLQAFSAQGHRSFASNAAELSLGG